MQLVNEREHEIKALFERVPIDEAEKAITELLNDGYVIQGSPGFEWSMYTDVNVAVLMTKKVYV